MEKEDQNESSQTFPLKSYLSTKTRNEVEAMYLLMKKRTRKHVIPLLNTHKRPKIVIPKDLPPFQWCTPYIPKDFTIPKCDFDGSDQKIEVSFKEVFDNWFNKYLLDTTLSRKKALCLFSKTKGFGKTSFIRSLVNNPRYILEFNTKFYAINCESNHIPFKLVFINDLEKIYDKNRIYLKRLVASEETTVRDTKSKRSYRISLPCIITTHSIDIARSFTLDPLFNTQVIFIEISNHMGSSECDKNKTNDTKNSPF